MSNRKFSLSESSAEIFNQLDVNTKDVNSIVQKAAYENRFDLTHLLIKEKGANPEYAAWGAGEGNNEKLVDEIISLVPGAKDFAIEAAALKNHGALVQRLLEKGANRNYAARGAGAGNNVELLKLLINDNQNRNFAVWGAALGNHVPLVWSLIEEGASLDDAVWGAAAGGHIDLVEQLINEGANPHRAIQGAAAGGHTALINTFTLDAESREFAVRGAIEGGYHKGDERKTLQFISMINDASLRQLLMTKVKEENKNVNINALSAKINKLRNVMKDNDLNFAQAQAWLMPELHCWFLEGVEKVRDRTFPLEMFIHIGSYVAGLSTHDTIDLFVKHFHNMARKLFDFSINEASERYNPAKKRWSLFTLFSNKTPETAITQYLDEQKNAVEKYRKRLEL